MRYNTIIEYIINQAETYERINIQFEQNIIKDILKVYDKYADIILDDINILNVSSMISYQNLLSKVESKVRMLYNEIYRILQPKIGTYYNTAYRNTKDLIDIGTELTQKYSTIKEMKEKDDKLIDPEAIKYLKDHAFNYVTNISNDILLSLKGQLSSMMASGQWDKQLLEDKIYNILNKNRSRAESIAQTELSLAYNTATMNRLDEYNRYNTQKMQKYWHGFKYSEVTCTYCRPRIGTKYDINDNTEVLPAHVRCRCVWLPYSEGWDSPISNMAYRNADMIKRTYSPDDIYRKINQRLNINYAQNLKLDDAITYLSGETVKDFDKLLGTAREHNIAIIYDNFDIAREKAEQRLSKEFNTQLDFWKSYTSGLISDNDKIGLNNAHTAIKGIMILPWTPQQMTKWDSLLKQLNTFMINM